MGGINSTGQVRSLGLFARTFLTRVRRRSPISQATAVSLMVTRLTTSSRALASMVPYVARARKGRAMLRPHTIQEYQLVFSDEFNLDGRTFYPGDDPYFEAVDLEYHATSSSPSFLLNRSGAY